MSGDAQRELCREHPFVKPPGPRRLPKTGAENGGIRGRQQIVEIARARDAAADDFRAARQHGVHIVGMRRDVHEPGPDPQCGFGGKPNRPGHPRTGTDQQ
jgi:hypothetical protein